jgi:hypothetical protein
MGFAKAQPILQTLELNIFDRVHGGHEVRKEAFSILFFSSVPFVPSFENIRVSLCLAGCVVRHTRKAGIQLAREQAWIPDGRCGFVEFHPLRRA